MSHVSFGCIASSAGESRRGARVVAALAAAALALTSFACSSNGREGAVASPATAAPVATKPPAADARPKIVAIGDSLTAGFGLSPDKSYPSLLQKRLDREGYQYAVVNAGVSGDTSAGGVRRAEWCLDGDVRIVILELGANDGLRGLSVADMKRNLQTIIDRAREKNATVILSGMEAVPNLGPDYQREFHNAFPELAKRNGVPLIPFFLEGVAGHESLNQSDGIHPNERGTQMVCDTVWKTLAPLLKK
jgi:acyl-CoA thioesterase-1